MQSADKRKDPDVGVLTTGKKDGGRTSSSGTDRWSLLAEPEEHCKDRKTK